MGRVAAPLPLAETMPVLGDEVGYVGYPLGVLTRSKGNYFGDIDGPFVNWNNYTHDAPCNPGASGSGMYHAGGVWGVLVRRIVVGQDVLSGDAGCVASPLPQILDILNHRL
jgi:hypothetical protein